MDSAWKHASDSKSMADKGYYAVRYCRIWTCHCHTQRTHKPSAQPINKFWSGVFIAASAGGLQQRPLVSHTAQEPVDNFILIIREDDMQPG